jgi:hypothetical protein
MPKKRTRAPKNPSSDATAASAAVAAPSLHRTAANAYLYNEDLFGLNVQLDYRTRLIISCYVMDNIPASVVRAAFAKAHIYPPSAVRELKRDVSCRSGGMATRESSRIAKDNAARKLEELGQRASLMSSSDIICQAQAIVKGVLNTDRYALKPLEELATGSRSRKKKKEDDVRDAAGPAHKKVVGMFTPAHSQIIAEAFSETDRFYNDTHLFVCLEDGCDRRFALQAWLAKHQEDAHGIARRPLTPQEEVARKSMMERQRQAHKNKANGAVAIPTDDDDDFLYECTFEGHDSICGVRTKTNQEMWQHYARVHPAHLLEGIGARDLKTGEEFVPAKDHDVLSEEAAEVMRLIMADNLDMCSWEAVCSNVGWLVNWAEHHGQIAFEGFDVNAVFEAFKQDVASDDPQYVYRDPSASSSPPHPPPQSPQAQPSTPHPPPQSSQAQLSTPRATKVSKVRKCTKCRLQGHQANSKKCRYNRSDVSLSLSASPNASPIAMRTPPTRAKGARADITTSPRQ